MPTAADSEPLQKRAAALLIFCLRSRPAAAPSVHDRIAEAHARSIRRRATLRPASRILRTPRTLPIHSRTAAQQIHVSARLHTTSAVRCMCRSPPTLPAHACIDSDSLHARSRRTSVVAVCCIQIDVSAKSQVAASAVAAMLSPLSMQISKADASPDSCE